MPKKTTPGVGLSYGWSLGEGPWNLDVDANTKTIATLLGGSVISNTATAPPATPANGDAYIVPAGATGAWLGKTNDIAAWIDSAWFFIVPKRGLRIEVQSASGFKYFDGTAWAAEPSSGGGGGSSKKKGFLARTTTAQSIPNGVATAITNWTTASDNSGGAFNAATGVFTAPEDGWYDLTVQLQFSAAPYAVSDYVIVNAAVDGTAIVGGQERLQAAIASTFFCSPCLGTSVFLTAGQALTVQSQNGRSAGTPLVLSTIPVYNFFGVTWL